jgi:uncharacterized protein (DUF1697 family)
MSRDTTWIVLFRGVGGKTQLPVTPLREKLTEAGFRDVATYINSGNAVMTTRKSREAATKEIAAICSREFGFDKDIHLRSAEEWRELIDNNPFPEALDVPKFLHAAVLAGKPPDDTIEKLRGFAADGERIELVGLVVYLHTPNGFGTSKLAEKFDKGIGVANTARNWNTVLKLAAMAGAGMN